jgi:hypothetical protein
MLWLENEKYKTLARHEPTISIFCIHAYSRIRFTETIFGRNFATDRSAE